MSAAGRWFITPHAVQRLRERIDPSLDYERALAVLIDSSSQAHLVRVLEDGTELWRAGRPWRWRFRVAPSHGRELPQLLTVLPAFDAARK